ncbi:MAG: DNA gyrase [Eggerthella lenta]
MKRRRTPISRSTRTSCAPTSSTPTASGGAHFNSVTLPKGTVIDGVDVSYYQFSPMFVNESRYRGENYRDIPLLTDREVWLKKSVLDENGQPVLDGDGRPAKDVVRVMPAQIKEALDRSRSEYLQSLREGERRARIERLGNGDTRRPEPRESRCREVGK